MSNGKAKFRHVLGHLWSVGKVVGPIALQAAQALAAAGVVKGKAGSVLTVITAIENATVSARVQAESADQ